MGRRRGRPRNRNFEKKPESNEKKVDRGENKQGDDGRVIIRENALFEKFYKAQHIISDDEWDSFMAALRRDLPASFRLVGCRSETNVILRLLKERYLSKMGDMVIDGVVMEPPAELPWYPAGLGYQMRLPRQVVRRQPLLSAFHNFLVTETEMGNISRQEAVSMIPPLLLDVQPHHKVLDMCAAPGSKTAQLIELLHGGGDHEIPSGFVLANDSDNKRCYLLVHQSLKRLNSPCCLVSNLDASIMSNILLPDETGRMMPIRFDRILCDVPCSGDGTLRKNLAIWKEFSLYHAYNLHKLQFRIAKRGLEMLEVGGIMVYSTCSLNPAEDEATVYRLLDFAEGAVELVDVSDKLVSLKRRPGLHSWTLMDKRGNVYSSFDDVPRDLRRQTMTSTIFPPTESAARDAHLERCVRIMPHDQDTGGFFVAVLKKTKEIPSMTVARNIGATASVGEANNDCTPKDSPKSQTVEPPEKKPKYSGFKEDPFVFLEESDPWWHNLKELFDVREDFPHSQLLFRCNENAKKKNAYFVNDALKKVLEHNQNRMKFINAGLRLFARTDEKEGIFQYRLAQEGLKVIVPFIRKRLITLSNEDDLIKLIKAPNILIKDLSSDTQLQVADLAEGSLAIVYKRPSNEQIFMLSGWRGKVSIAAYVAQENRVHILRMLDQDTTAIEEEMVRQRKKATPKEDDAQDEIVGQGDGQDPSTVKEADEASGLKAENDADIEIAEAEASS